MVIGSEYRFDLRIYFLKMLGTVTQFEHIAKSTDILFPLNLKLYRIDEMLFIISFIFNNKVWMGGHITLYTNKSLCHHLLRWILVVTNSKFGNV